MNIKDRTDGQAPAPTHYTGRLVTSDKQAHAEAHQDLGVALDNQSSQAPHIPPEHESAEISVVGQNIEPCTAAHAEQGGHQADGLTAMSPVVAKLEGGFVTKTIASAHQLSTITHQDHQEMHGKCDLAKPGGLDTITELAEGKGIPPATKAEGSVSIGHPVRAKSGAAPFARPVFKSTEPVITGNPPTPGETGAANPVVARVMQPRSSEAKGGYVVRNG